MLSRRSFATALAAAACSCTNGSRKRIAVIPKAVSHLYWVSVQNGAVAAGKEFNAEIIWRGPEKETDVEGQIRILDSMIKDRVDGIAIAACDRTTLVPHVERAADAKIPVTVFDSGLDTKEYVSLVATDNVEAGRLAARKIGEVLGPEGKVGVIMHAPGSASTMDREEGFRRTMGREFPGIEIVGGEYGMSDVAKSRAVAESILSANPDLDAMFASSEPSSVGAALAIKTRKLQDKIYLLAFDSSEAMLDDLRGGAIDAMIVQDPHRMGYEAVRTLVMKLNGRNPPRRLDLNPTLVQKKDLNEPNVKRLLNLN